MTSIFDLNRVKVTVSFDVQRELVPGCFYDPQEFADAVQRAVEYQLEAYKPQNFVKEVTDK